MMIPDSDLVITAGREIKFIVSKKMDFSNRWIDIKECLSLPEAFSICILELKNSRHVSIWVVGENGNFLYWDSNFPDLFNSPVLEN